MDVLVFCVSNPRVSGSVRVHVEPRERGGVLVGGARPGPAHLGPAHSALVLPAALLVAVDLRVHRLARSLKKNPKKINQSVSFHEPPLRFFCMPIKVSTSSIDKKNHLGNFDVSTTFKRQAACKCHVTIVRDVGIESISKMVAGNRVRSRWFRRYFGPSRKGERDFAMIRRRSVSCVPHKIEMPSIQ